MQKFSELYVDMLTNETRKDYEEYIATQKTSFDIMRNIVLGRFFDGEFSHNAGDIAKRIQTEYLYSMKSSSKLKTLNNWAQFEETEPNEVVRIIPAVVEGLYSSFALKQEENSDRLRYPLDDDFTSDKRPFAGKDFSLYKQYISQISENMGVKVIESNQERPYAYDKKRLSTALLKIRRKTISLFKKTNDTEISSYNATFRGKIRIGKMIEGYKVSKQERMVKIFDSLLEVAINKYEKEKLTKTNDIGSNIRLSYGDRFATRLYANILITKALDYGDSGKLVEKCLMLQFANILNKYNVTSKSMEAISMSAFMSASTVLSEMGMSIDEIKQNFEKNGYYYTAEPTNVFEALSGAINMPDNIHTLPERIATSDDYYFDGTSWRETYGSTSNEASRATNGDVQEERINNALQERLYDQIALLGDKDFERYLLESRKQEALSAKKRQEQLAGAPQVPALAEGNHGAQQDVSVFDSSLSRKKILEDYLTVLKNKGKFMSGFKPSALEGIESVTTTDATPKISHRKEFKELSLLKNKIYRNTVNKALDAYIQKLLSKKIQEFLKEQNKAKSEFNRTKAKAEFEFLSKVLSYYIINLNYIDIEDLQEKTQMAMKNKKPSDTAGCTIMYYKENFLKEIFEDETVTIKKYGETTSTFINRKAKEIYAQSFGEYLDTNIELLCILGTTKDPRASSSSWTEA